MRKPQPKPLTNEQIHRGCECGGAWIGVEYRGTSQDYDGVSEWECESCSVRIGRWSGVELQPHQIERRRGGEPIAEVRQ